jgi:hypothetical protein
MYTIRNPAFQNAFSGGFGMPINPQPVFTPHSIPVEPSSSSSLSNNNINTNINGSNNNNRGFMPSGTSFVNDSECHLDQAVPEVQPKCSSVIGSEMRNVLQRRKEQEYAQMDPYGMGRSNQYSHFGGSGMNFNQSDDTFMSRGFSSTSNTPVAAQNYDDLRLQPGKMLNSEVHK